MMILRNLFRSPIAVALCTVCIAGLVYIGCSVMIQAGLPADGTLWTEISASGLYVANVLTPTPGGLEAGDQIVAIKGRPIWDWIDDALAGQTPVGWRIGQTVLYRVMRDGKTIDIPVTLQPFPLLQLLTLRVGVLALLLISLGISGYVMLARPRDSAARLLFLLATCLTPTLALHVQLFTIIHPTLFIVENIIKFMCRNVLPMAFLHLFLIFPVSKPVLRGRETWLRLMYFAPPIVSASIGLLFGQTRSEIFTLMWRSTTAFGPLLLILGVASAVHTYVTVRQMTTRSQIRWIAWGSLVGLLPYIALTAIPEILAGRGVLTVEVTSFFIIVLPITIAISIARYRLFDIDLLIRRSVLYALLAGFLAAVYLTLVTVLNQIVLTLTGNVNNTVVVFASTLIVSTAFWALRIKIAQMMSLVIYRNRIEPNALLTEMSERLSVMMHLEDLKTLLTQTIPRQIGAQRGDLQLPGQDSLHLDTSDGRDRLLAWEKVWESWRARGTRPLLRSMLPAWVPAGSLQKLVSPQTELILPLVVGEQMIGLWSLQARSSGAPYTSDEIRVLGALARQAAVSIQNARLVSQLEAQSHWLAQEVKNRTRALEDERNRLKVILQNMADGLLVTTPDSRVLLTNAALENMVRGSAKILIGQPITWAVNCPALSDLIAKSWATPGQVVNNTFELNNLVLYASSSTLRDRSSVITVLRDVTHQVEIDRIKSEFITTVSHELRTPLTSVMGFAKLIHRSFEHTILPALPPETQQQKSVQRIHKNLEIIIAEAERLTRLINDVLDISKMNEGKVEWNDQPISIKELVQQTVQLLVADAEKKGLKIVNQVTNPLLPLTADPDRIRQVLTNLLSNAVKFTEQGQITITAQKVPPGSAPEHWQPPDPAAWGVMVAVADTGVGIAEKDLPRLFSRFQQIGGNMLTDKPKGTGLGLAICKEIVTHYGGAIWAEPVAGRGIAFAFILPSSHTA